MSDNERQEYQKELEEKIQIQNYILQKQGGYDAVLAVHMDTWIVDIIWASRDWNIDIPAPFYYGKLIEYFQNEYVKEEEAVRVGEMFSLSNIMKELVTEDDIFQFTFHCKKNNDYYLTLFQLRLKEMEDGKSVLFIAQREIRERMSFSNLEERMIRIRERQMAQILQTFYTSMIFVNLKEEKYQYIDLENKEFMKAIDVQHLEELLHIPGMKIWKEVILNIRELFPFEKLCKATLDTQKEDMTEVYSVMVEDRIAWYESGVFFLDEWNEKIACIATREVTAEIKSKNMIKAQNKVLRNALADAKAASTAKSVFLSNISHDVRTPLNAIHGMATVAKNNLNDTDKVESCMDSVIVASKHMLGIINNIMDMSQLENHKIELHPERSDLEKMMSEMKETLLPHCQERNQHFTIDCHVTPYRFVKMDENRVRQILLNLIMNAIQFTPAGGNVTVSLEEQKTFGFGYVNLIFRVTDTGIGMSEQFLNQIYDPFEQENNHLSDQNEGTGLGMAIVRRLLDMMDGTIKINSMIGKGTSVTAVIKVPYLRDNKRKYENTDEESEHKYPRKRILIVEDKRINIEIVKELLNGTEIEIDEVHNGLEAVNIVEKMAPYYYDLIFMDVRMPVMKGDEATMKIRKLGRKDCREIPIVAMTANALEADVQHAMEVGMNGFIPKPVDPDEMFRIMDDCLA